MFANLDRAQFLALLEKLGSEDDAEVLGAARDLNAKVTVAGISWEDLLVPEEDEAPEEEAAESDTGEDDNDEDASATPSAPDGDVGPLDDAEKNEARSLIDAIGRFKIGAATREELADYRRELDEGEFSQMDLRYLRALSRRLSK